MPIVRIDLYDGRSAEQKAACARDVIEAVARHLNVPTEATQVVFFDVDKGNWIMGAKRPPVPPAKE